MYVPVMAFGPVAPSSPLAIAALCDADKRREDAGRVVRPLRACFELCDVAAPAAEATAAPAAEATAAPVGLPLPWPLAIPDRDAPRGPARLRPSRSATWKAIRAEFGR